MLNFEFSLTVAVKSIVMATPNIFQTKYLNITCVRCKSQEACKRKAVLNVANFKRISIGIALLC